MTVERMVELLEIEKECVLRNASGECNRYCAGCDLLQDDTELHEMYTEALALLKAQEPRVMAGAELTDAELIEEIRKAPLVLKPNVDAVPVVRCRECMYFRPWRHDRGEDSRCEFWNAEIGAEDYCSQAIYLNNKMDGERRDES